MPEVPEIVLTSQILLKYLKNKILDNVKLISGRYTRNKPDNYNQFVKALPLQLTDVNSKGKFLYFTFKDPKSDKKWYIWNTFGLTGMWSLDEAKYERVSLNFKGITAYYCDMRNFGTLKFSNDYEKLEKKLASLAPDFLKDNFDISKITQYHEPVVKVLMSQKLIGSGIGNYLSAEILYRAKISPHHICDKLTPKEVKTLNYWIRYTTKLAYDNNDTGYMADLAPEAQKIKRIDYHPEIKLKSKKFIFKVYRQKTDPYGNKVKADKIIKNRTTYWVPKVQK